MKKFGFTLAELIVTLSVIAVAAALIAPMIGNIMPDKNKIKVLNCYNAVGTALDSLFSDENEYHPATDIVYDDNHDPIGTKLRCEGMSCFGNDSTEIKEKLWNKIGINTTDNTKNNILWEWTKESDNYIIEVDMEPDKTGYYYGESGFDSKKIDTYRFKISKHGKLSPNDNLTRAYLENPLKMNSRKVDLKKAATY